jgi:hypothetical protein
MTQPENVGFSKCFMQNKKKPAACKPQQILSNRRAAPQRIIRFS